MSSNMRRDSRRDRYHSHDFKGTVSKGYIGIEVTGNIEGALKKLSRMTSSNLSEYRKATSHYTKPNQMRHQRNKDAQRKRKLALRPEKTKKRDKRRR